MQRQKGRPGSMSSILAKIEQDGSTSHSHTNITTTHVESTPPTQISRPSPISVDASVHRLTSSLTSFSVTDDSAKDPDYVVKEELVDVRIAGILDKV